MVNPDTLLPPPDASHRCEKMDAALELYDDLCEDWGRDGRGSEGPLLWGKALQRIERRRGRWWGHNGEYAVPIRHCPFCGTAL